MSLSSRLANLSYAQLLEFAVDACESSPELKNKADGLIAEVAPLPSWCVDILLSPDLLPQLFSSLGLSEHAAAGVCTTWSRAYSRQLRRCRYVNPWKRGRQLEDCESKNPNGGLCMLPGGVLAISSNGYGIISSVAFFAARNDSDPQALAACRASSLATTPFMWLMGLALTNDGLLVCENNDTSNGPSQQPPGDPPLSMRQLVESLINAEPSPLDIRDIYEILRNDVAAHLAERFEECGQVREFLLEAASLPLHRTLAALQLVPQLYPALAAAGAVREIVALLGTGNCRLLAAGLLQLIVDGSSRDIIDAGALPMLLELMGYGNSQLRSTASDLLMALAKRCPMELVAAGVVPRLVAMLPEETRWIAVLGAFVSSVLSLLLTSVSAPGALLQAVAQYGCLFDQLSEELRPGSRGTRGWSSEGADALGVLQDALKRPEVALAAACSENAPSPRAALGVLLRVRVHVTGTLESDTYDPEQGFLAAILLRASGGGFLPVDQQLDQCLDVAANIAQKFNEAAGDDREAAAVQIVTIAGEIAEQICKPTDEGGAPTPWHEAWLRELAAMEAGEAGEAMVE